MTQWHCDFSLLNWRCMGLKLVRHNCIVQLPNFVFILSPTSLILSFPLRVYACFISHSLSRNVFFFRTQSSRYILEKLIWIISCNNQRALTTRVSSRYFRGRAVGWINSASRISSKISDFWGDHSAGRIRHFRAEFGQNNGKSVTLMACTTVVRKTEN